MHNTNRLFRVKKVAAFALALLIFLLTAMLPVAAKSPRGMAGDLRDGIREFGRDVSDALDPDDTLPDTNGGILPGMTEDNRPGGTADSPATTTAPVTTTAPLTTTARTTARTSSATTAVTTAENSAGDTMTDDGAFPWMGIIIALVIIAAVVLIVILLFPSKKS